MYLKQDDTYVTNDINLLPIKDLKVTDKIILLDGNLNTILTLAEVSDNKKLFLFGGVETSVQHRYEEYFDNDDDEQPSSIENVAWLDTSYIYQEYLYIFDDLMQIRKNKDLNLPEKVSIKDNHLGFPINMVFNEIYEKNTVEYHNNKFTMDKAHYCFFAYKLDEDNCIAFIVSNHIDGSQRIWKTSKDCYLINKNGDYYYLSNSFVNILYRVKQEIKRQSYVPEQIKKRFNEFNDLLEIMIDSVPISAESIEKRVWDTYIQLRDYYQLKDIQDLFSPIYSNPALDFKVFIEKFNTYFNTNIKFSYKESSITNYTLKSGHLQSLDEEIKTQIKNEMRIGEAVSRFFLNNKNKGFDPVIGEFYINGHIDESIKNNKQYYKDTTGIILENKDSWGSDKMQYYININGYYVPTDDSDKDFIEELKQRKETLIKLEEAL